MNFELAQDADVGWIEWRNLIHILFETQTVGDPHNWIGYDVLNRIVGGLYGWANTNQRVPQLDAFLSVVDDVCTQPMMDESGNMVPAGTWLRSMPQMKQVFIPGDFLYVDGFTYDGRTRPVGLTIRAYRSDTNGNLSKITSGFVRITMTSATGLVVTLPDFNLSQTSRYIDLASIGNFNGAWFVQSRMYADNQWTGALPTWTVTYPQYYPTPNSGWFNWQEFPWRSGGLIYLVGISADGTISNKPLPAIPNGHFVKDTLGNDINYSGYAIWQADTFRTPLWIDLNPGVRMVGKVPMGQFSQFIVVLNP